MFGNSNLDYFNENNKTFIEPTLHEDVKKIRFSKNLKNYILEQYNYALNNNVEKVETPVKETPVKTVVKPRSYQFTDNFIEIMLPIYQKELKKIGKDENYASYLVAQSALESDWGRKVSGLNNFGGIKETRKGKGTIRNTKEEYNGIVKKEKHAFRDFDTIEDYAKFHVNLLNNNRYKAFDGDFIDRVVKGGYATASNYNVVLKSVYDKVKNYVS